MKKIRILIVTDLGDDVDDAAALMLALGCPDLEILGITTVFQDAVKRKEMVADLLKQWGREDIPVHSGAGSALMETARGDWEEPIQYALLDRAGGSREKQAGHVSPGEEKENTEGYSETAVDFILETVKREPELVILEMGCMTNLAKAFLREPERMKKVRILAMGGAFFSTAPEWNIICDPEAASVVVEQSENLVMMGLDVTKYLKVSPERVDEWRGRGSKTMEYYLRGVDMFRNKTGYPITLHDVLLVAYLIDPQVVTLKKGHFSVELAGRLTRGTMVDRSNYYEIDPQIEKNFRFAEKVDPERFFGVMDRYF